MRQDDPIDENWHVIGQWTKNWVGRGLKQSWNEALTNNSWNLQMMKLRGVNGRKCRERTENEVERDVK